MRYAEIHLPYFKQGDDLGHYLSSTQGNDEALEAHAQQMDAAASILREVKKLISGKDVKFEADTHMIVVSGPDDVIQALIDADMAQVSPCDEDEGEDEIEDECDEEDFT